MHTVQQVLGTQSEAYRSAVVLHHIFGSSVKMKGWKIPIPASSSLCGEWPASIPANPDNLILILKTRILEHAVIDGKVRLLTIGIQESGPVFFQEQKQADHFVKHVGRRGFAQLGGRLGEHFSVESAEFGYDGTVVDHGESGVCHRTGFWAAYGHPRPCVVSEIGLDRFVEHDIRIDEEKPVDSLRSDKITQREILLMAKEDPRVLVVGKMFVGKQLGEFTRFVKVVFVTVVFYPEVKAVAPVTEQDQPALGIRTACLRDGMRQIKTVPAVDEDDGRRKRHGGDGGLRLEIEPDRRLPVSKLAWVVVGQQGDRRTAR